MDRVTRVLADRLAERRLDREPVGAVALRHQRTVERLAVDRTADLHEPTRAEQLGHVVHDHARPRTGVVALLKLSVELSHQHSSRRCRHRRSAECTTTMLVAAASSDLTRAETTPASCRARYARATWNCAAAPSRRRWHPPRACSSHPCGTTARSCSASAPTPKPSRAPARRPGYRCCTRG